MTNTTSRSNLSGKNSIQRDGRKISLTDTPLVAYELACGHLGRDHAIQLGDLLFCLECVDHRTVFRIVNEG